MLHQIDLLINSNKILIKGLKFPKLYIPGFKEKLVKKEKFITIQTKITPEKNLLRDLKNFRDREARKLKWKKFMVIQNAVLSRIAKQKPESIDELSSIKGIGENRIQKYSEEILRIVSKYI